MREYHIYMQRTKPVECHCNYTTYKWLPWEYVGYVVGTKELYKYFKLKFKYSMGVLISTIHLTILKMNISTYPIVGTSFIFRLMNITDI